jgi:SAM-dependent methyltransferase
MGKLTQRLDELLYPGYSSNWDDRMFRDSIIRYLKPEMRILDLGAGAGIVSQMNFLGKAQQVCGVDLDARVIDNPYLDEGRISDAGEIPYSDSTFDMVFSDNVLEHLEWPENVFSEVARVLKPGGYFLFKTPNKWHYMPTIARLTPIAFHQYINKIRGRNEVDTFPTRYQANTKGDVIRLANGSGFSVVSIDRIEGRPEYLRMSAMTYLIGFFYERVVNASALLCPFRVLLIGVLKKHKVPGVA